MNLLVWPCQSPTLNENVNSDYPFNLIDAELLCKDECVNVSGCRCGNMVQTYPKGLVGVTAMKGVLYTVLNHVG